MSAMSWFRKYFRTRRSAPVEPSAVFEERIWVGGDAATAGLVRGILSEDGRKVSEVAGDVGGISPDLGFAGGYYVLVVGTEEEISSARQAVDEFHGT